MVAATDLIATLPSKIVKDVQIPGLRIIPAPLPPVEVSAHLFWHPRAENSPLRAWLCEPHQGDGGGLIDFRSPDPDFGAPRRAFRSGIRSYRRLPVSLQTT